MEENHHTRQVNPEKTHKIRQLTITVIGPNLGQLLKVARDAIDTASYDPDAIIEIYMGKAEEAPDGTTRD